MIKLNSSVRIRGISYSEGDPYEGPEEQHMVNIGRAEFVDPADVEPVKDPVFEVGKEPIKKKAPAKKKFGRKKAEDK